jgi:hypothetical protein
MATDGGFWESAGTMAAVVVPLVSVPLTVLTFHLRSLRESQDARIAEIRERLQANEQRLADCRSGLCDVQRNYVTKEDWLRELLAARRRLEDLTEAVVRCRTVVETMGSARGPGGETAAAPAGRDHREEAS